jgi:hypothetical protein
MNIKISNKLNYIPAIINIIWSLIILFLFIVRIPESSTKPDGGMLIIGIIIISIIIFIISLIYIFVVNLYNKTKIYLDLYLAFFPVIILLTAILL